ncbi:hypothetical protein vseg_009647 [Gypsophila vaccaria]
MEKVSGAWLQNYNYFHQSAAAYPNIHKPIHRPLHPLGGGWVYPPIHGPYIGAHWRPYHVVQMVPDIRTHDQEFDYFVVIDFEATCDKLKNPHPQEIIEFPSVLVNSRSGEVEDSFQIYVRPTHNQHLTEFCKDLTGIQQSQVDEGVLLSEALYLHDKWLEEKGIKNTKFAIVTWSNWDCRVILESECRYKKIKKPSYFNRWINLKVPFGEAFDGVRCNLKEAVELAGLTWEGRAHSGLDDAMNTARLLTHLMALGSKLSITNTIMWETDNDDDPTVTQQQIQTHPASRPVYLATPYRPAYFTVIPIPGCPPKEPYVYRHLSPFIVNAG